MPVQDNDDKRTADQPAVDAEELRRKQAQSLDQQQDENSVQNPGKLLPLLNAKAEHHQSRIDSLDEKIANQTDKIDRNKANIEALSAKADKLEDTNRMLKATIGNLPGMVLLSPITRSVFRLSVRRRFLSDSRRSTKRGRRSTNLPQSVTV